MSWIENIRQKSRKEKSRIIAIIAGVVLILLIIFWVVIGMYNPFESSNSSFWDSVKTEIKDAQQEKLQ
jgi:hypothetical protein